MERQAKVVGEFSLILPVDRIDFQSSSDNGILLVSNVTVREGKDHFHVSSPTLLQSVCLCPLSLVALFYSPFLVFSFHLVLCHSIRSQKRYPDQSSRSKRDGEGKVSVLTGLFDEIEFPKICDV